MVLKSCRGFVVCVTSLVQLAVQAAYNVYDPSLAECYGSHSWQPDGHGLSDRQCLCLCRDSLSIDTTSIYLAFYLSIGSA